MKQNVYDKEGFFAGYIALRKTNQGYNDALEIPNFRSMLPGLAGKRILNLGCGWGKNCEWYIRQGAAEVIGLDISERMISYAREFHAHPRIHYFCKAMEDYSFPIQDFDLVVSSLAFHYVAGYESLMAGVARTLRKGGHLVFSQEHPIITTGEWLKDDMGNKEAWLVINYPQSRPFVREWLDSKVVIYHRTISEIINPMLENGLLLEDMKEPIVNKNDLAKYPKLVNTYKVTPFIFFRARK